MLKKFFSKLKIIPIAIIALFMLIAPLAGCNLSVHDLPGNTIEDMLRNIDWREVFRDVDLTDFITEEELRNMLRDMDLMELLTDEDRQRLRDELINDPVFINRIVDEILRREDFSDAMIWSVIDRLLNDPWLGDLLAQRIINEILHGGHINEDFLEQLMDMLMDRLFEGEHFSEEFIEQLIGALLESEHFSDEFVDMIVETVLTRLETGGYIGEGMLTRIIDALIADDRLSDETMWRIVDLLFDEEYEWFVEAIIDRIFGGEIDDRVLQNIIDAILAREDFLDEFMEDIVDEVMRRLREDGIGEGMMDRIIEEVMDSITTDPDLLRQIVAAIVEGGHLEDGFVEEIVRAVLEEIGGAGDGLIEAVINALINDEESLQALIGALGGNETFRELIMQIIAEEIGIGTGDPPGNEHDLLRAFLRWHLENDPIIGPLYRDGFISSEAMDHLVEIMLQGILGGGSFPGL